MATKVKPSRLKVSGTPQVGQVPVYVDEDTFQRGTGGGNGDVTGPASSTDGHLAVFDGATGKIIKDGGAPTPVVDALNSTSATSALSANQGKVLNDKISDLFGLGKFLSLWDATTGLPVSFPLSTPYTYNTGDYYLVETVSSATPPVNYKPTGSSYSGTASTVTESGELAAGDIYIYDGSTWLLQLNHGKTVSFSEIAGDPYDNTDLSTALAAKQDELVSDVNIRTINGTSILGSGDITTPVGPTYTAGNGININSSDVISNSQPGPAVSSSAPVSPSQGAMWYDTTNDELKTYDGSNWNGIGGGDAKVFAISDLTSAANIAIAQAAYDYAYTNGKYAIIMYNGGSYAYAFGYTTYAYFTRAIGYGAVSSGNRESIATLKLTVSNGSVTAIAQNSNQIAISSSVPTSGANSTITIVI